MVNPIENSVLSRLGLVPLSEAEKAPMQKLFVSGHLLPGVDLSPEALRIFIDQLGEATEMNIFHGPTIKTPNDFDQETFRRLGGRPPEDINVTWMWDDSGGSIYVFPQKDYWCVVDLHTCKMFGRQRVLRLLYQQLHFREDMQYAEQTYQTSTPWQAFTMEGRTFTPEAPYLAAFSEILATNLTDIEAVIKAGSFLESIVYRAIRERWGARLAAVFKPELASKLRDLHSAYEIATDDLFMRAVLGGEATGADQYPFQATYNRLAQMEVKAAEMQVNKPVMHIGTGWPGTAIGIYQQYGIPVICVEKNPKVAQQSKDALIKLDLYGANKLLVINDDGININPSRFGTVIVSAMVPTKDKIQIISNLRDLAVDTSGPQLVLRQPPDNARGLFYQPLPAEILSDPNRGLIFVPQTQPGVEDPLQSLVLHVHPRASTGRGYDSSILAAQRRLVAA